MPPLHLDKPLAVFDIESTGINRKTDRIIDLCIIKIMPDNTRKTYRFRVNPEIPIPAETTAIHGITDADVAGAPPFREIAPEVHRLLEDCDLAGFNLLHFDIPLLAEEFNRAGIAFDTETPRVLDAQRIFHKKEPRDLSAALRFYCDQEHEGAHGAEADVVATIQIFEAQMERYADVPHDMDGLDAYCHPRHPDWVDRTGKLIKENGRVVINFGKYQGRPVKELAAKERNFLNWVLKKDFPRDTQDIIRHIMEGGDETEWLGE